MNGKPQVELRNLKHAEFASQETACYEATVYIDGKRFCIASNQGHGGPDSYDSIRPRGGYKSGEEAGAAHRELDENIHNVGLRHNPNALRTYPKGGFPYDAEKWIDDDDERHAAQDREMSESDQVTTVGVFEYLVGDALTVALYSKDMKSAMSKKWLYIKKPGGRPIWECQRRKGHDAATMIEVIRKGDPEAVLLNTMPTAEALAIWRAN
jgi:hypothetical protein